MLSPEFIAQTCPKPLMFLLTALVGFYLSLRRRSVRPLERLILAVLGEGEEGQVGCGRAAAKTHHKTRSIMVASSVLDRTLRLCDSRRAGKAALQSWTWIVLGLATVAAALAMLERIEPCYFAQDDNFANVLPGILQGCRSIFHGEFPDFDPCQLMGMPSAGKGAYTLLYPPTVVSYCIARWGLGNENYTLEVFAAMHLLAGYLASYAAARTVGLRPALAYVLGISFVLAGYIPSLSSSMARGDNPGILAAPAVLLHGTLA